jgi:hypothetical protein
MELSCFNKKDVRTLMKYLTVVEAACHFHQLVFMVCL